jgi:hypothetical protein
MRRREAATPSCARSCRSSRSRKRTLIRKLEIEQGYGVAVAENNRLQKLGVDFIKQGDEFATTAEKRERELTKRHASRASSLCARGSSPQTQLDAAPQRHPRQVQGRQERAEDRGERLRPASAARVREGPGRLQPRSRSNAEANAEELSKTQAKLREIQASPVWAQFSRQQQEQTIYAAALAQRTEDEAAAIKKVKDAREAEMRLYYGESGRLEEGLRLAKEEADTLAIEVTLIGRTREERELAIAQRRVELALAKELARIDALPLGELDKEPLRAKARVKAEIDSNNAATKQVVEAWQRAADDINSSLTSAIEDWVIHGKSLGKSLANALKQEFSKLVLRPIISAILNSTGIPQALGQAAGGVTGQGGIGGIGALQIGGTSLGSLLGIAGAGAGIANLIGSFIGLKGQQQTAASIGGALFGGIPGAIIGALVKPGGGPKVESGFGAVPHPWQGDSGPATALAQALQQQYANIAAALGVTNTTLQGLTVFFAKDPQGTAKTQLQIAGGSFDRSKLAGGIENVGRSDSDLEAAISLASAQLILKNLQEQASGPIGDYLKAINITTASLETMQHALAIAQDVGGLQKAIDALGPSFAALKNYSVETQGSIIEAAGGLQNLGAGLSTFYDKFFTEQEKAAAMQSRVTAAFAQAGVALPASIEAYKAAVLDAEQHLDSEAGRKTFATLVDNAGLFYDAAQQVGDGIDQLSTHMDSLSNDSARLTIELMRAQGNTTGADSAQRTFDTQGFTDQELFYYDNNKGLQKQIDVLAERKGLQDQLDSLTLTNTELLEKQRDALDASNQALFDQVQTATKGRTVANERTNLQDQLDSLTMTSTQLLEKQRDALDESNRALFDQVKAAEAAARAAEITKGLTGERASLEAQLRAAQGDTSGAKDLQRTIDTQGLDEAQLALYDYNQSLKDQIETLTAAAQVTKTLTDQQDALRVQLLRAQGDTTGADTLQRTIDTVGMTDAQIAIYDYNQTLRAQIQTLSDAAAAQQKYDDITKSLTDRTKSLRVELLKAQGKDEEAKALQRTIDTAGLDAAQIAIYKYNQGLQDQIDALTLAAQKAQETKSAWQAIADSLFDEVSRIRGLTGTSPASFANAQAQFAITTAQARSGSQDAAKLLPGLSQSLLDLAKNNVATSFDLRRLQGETAGSLQTTGLTLAQQFNLDTPAWASELNTEISGLRADQQAQSGAIVGRLADTYKLFKEWDTNGLPEEREVSLA